MALFDLLGRRWVLRILWELRSGPLTFRALRASMDAVSPSVLNARLAELRAALLVEHGSDGYAMTPLGADLAASLTPVVDWAERWQRETTDPPRAARIRGKRGR
jgi:DNA-binding HxlR family transcriptional regulator